MVLLVKIRDGSLMLRNRMNFLKSIHGILWHPGGISTKFRIVSIISHRKSRYLWVINCWFGKITCWCYYWFIVVRNFKYSEWDDPKVKHFGNTFRNFYKYRFAPCSTENALTENGQHYNAPKLGQHRGNLRDDWTYICDFQMKPSLATNLEISKKVLIWGVMFIRHFVIQCVYLYSNAVLNSLVGLLCSCLGMDIVYYWTPPSRSRARWNIDHIRGVTP